MDREEIVAAEVSSTLIPVLAVWLVGETSMHRIISPIQNQNANDEELRMMVHIQMMMHTTNLKERLKRNI